MLLDARCFITFRRLSSDLCVHVHRISFNLILHRGFQFNVQASNSWLPHACMFYILVVCAITARVSFRWLLLYKVLTVSTISNMLNHSKI